MNRNLFNNKLSVAGGDTSHGNQPSVSSSPPATQDQRQFEMHPSYFYTACLFIGILFCQSCNNKKQFILMPAAKTGLEFKNKITETPENNIMTYQYMYNGAGIAAGDINNDGLPDVYLAGNSVPNKLFLNKGDWKFIDITGAAKINDRPGDWKTGVIMADINGDGWLDVYVCYSGNTAGEGLNKPVLIDNAKRSNQLFINQGCKPGEVPTFIDHAKEYGLDAPGTFSTQAYFFDYDRDDDLDMFLVNHANTFYTSLFNTTKLRLLRHPYFGNKLYRNNNNRFVEVSEQAGIHGSGLNYGLSAAISDINNDGWPDIYVTNDYDEQDFCYLNNKDGSFKEISHKAFGHISKYSMGCDIADVNNDSKPDIFVVDMLPEDNHRQKLLKGADQYDKYTLAADSGYHHQNMRNTLQVNYGINKDGIPEFSEQGQIAGLSNTDWSWGPLFADFDNDGFKDVMITNGYLHDYTNMDFLKYAQDKMKSRSAANVGSADMLELIQKMPSTKISSYMMQNVDGLHFENKTEEWGLSQKSISNGIVYADLDSDGDLDLVINKLNERVSVYKNDLNTTVNRFIKIRLSGNGLNRFGIGAKLWVTAGDKKIYHEAYFGRGYESSVEPVFTIGVGATKIINEIKVQWPDGKISVLLNVPTNQSLIFEQKKGVANMISASPEPIPFLTDVFAGSGIDYQHRENIFVDFKIQRLLPYQLSHLGGKLAVADVNNDGNDDVFFGGAVRHPGALYLGKDDGSFIPASSRSFTLDPMSEDMGAVFFDADGDVDKDLYVVSGGNEYGSGDSYYQDRLYINNGKGEFAKNTTALPQETTSGSCVLPYDYDKDGDLDLFVGGRLAAQLYPVKPKSFIFRNDSKGDRVKFTDVTSQLSGDLHMPGMVTDATWIDINDDTWPDLVLVGEWMPIRIFENEKGKHFKEVTASMGLAETQGWWSKIMPGDFDGDGDLDLVLGNAGANMQVHPTEAQPLEYFIQDVDNNSSLDAIMTYYIQGKSYPAATLDELLEQVPALRKKFFKYADYADATMEDIKGNSEFLQSDYLKVVTLRSSWLENQGGKFALRDLPDQAQLSMINGFVLDDFDGDNAKELLCAGNFYPYKVEWGQSDASMGALLRFKSGQATAYKPSIPLWLKGDIRDMAMVNCKNGGRRIVVSRNNDYPGLFKYGR